MRRWGGHLECARPIRILYRRNPARSAVSTDLRASAWRPGYSRRRRRSPPWPSKTPGSSPPALRRSAGSPPTRQPTSWPTASRCASPAAELGRAWNRLEFDRNGVAAAFGREVVTPVRSLCSRTIDVPAIVFGLLGGWLGAGWPADRIGRSYRRHLLGDATLADLPDRPRIVINATNLGSGVLWRFSKPYMWDWRVGEVAEPRIRLATAVAACAAFQPLLSPVRLRFRPSDFVAKTGQDLQAPPYTTRVALTDGGVYDNLGLETAWKKCRTVLI